MVREYRGAGPKASGPAMSPVSARILQTPRMAANRSLGSRFFASKISLNRRKFPIPYASPIDLEESSIMSNSATEIQEPATRRIDAIDRKILRVLQEDASLSVAEIGDRVGLSSTPCWKRIQRMEGEGIITGKVALVDQNKIGLGLSVFVSVESGDHSDAWLKRFAEAVSSMPEVLEFYRMAGDVDYMLRVVVADMQSYDIFYKKLISAVALKNVTSRFAMEKIKSVTALPVPSLEAA
jgi:Lrp/AsnC family transcriptional regulator